MKKLILLIFISAILITDNELQAQKKSTELYVFFAPNRAYTNIMSSNVLNNAYVEDRKNNEPARGGVSLGMLIEKSLTYNFSIQTGFSFIFYGLRPTRQNINPALNGNNPDRVSYIGRQEFYFASVPLEFKKDIIKFSKASKDLSKKVDFSLYALGGVAGQYMFQSNYERQYRLVDEREEITVNEFENNFTSNSFNMTVQGGVGLKTKLNQKWSVIIQPTISHQLFSIYSSGITERITTFYTVVGVGIQL